jgi:hypothetical protein
VSDDECDHCEMRVSGNIQGAEATKKTTIVN